MSVSYKTPTGYGEALIIEKKSRFIGYCDRAETEQQAIDFIAKIKYKHKDATHNCHAFFLKDGGISRCSDDGEPSGTAGVPILDVLRKSATQNAVVVVTRYFGGVLLGAGGLVRAYSAAAGAAVNASGISIISLCSIVEVSVEYSLYELVLRLVDSAGGKVRDTNFSDKVLLSLIFLSKDVEKFEKNLSELLKKNMENLTIEQKFMPF